MGLWVFYFAATKRRTKETDPAIQIHRLRPGQDVEFRILWQPGMSESSIHTRHECMC